VVVGGVVVVVTGKIVVVVPPHACTAGLQEVVVEPLPDGLVVVVP
jgi:hypothetical protein